MTIGKIQTLMEKVMRLSGRISDWNDAKGFGFVIPHDGGDRIFVHVNEFRRGSRRPTSGDLISYLPGKDAHGRLQARKIRHISDRAKQQRQPFRLRRAIVGIGSLAAVIGASTLQVIPPLIAGVYLALSCLSYLMYRADKAAAESGSRRTPENNLHLVDLLGGWPGALIAQQQFRHKTIKKPFQIVFWITVIINLAGTWWLVSSDIPFELAQAFNG